MILLSSFGSVTDAILDNGENTKVSNSLCGPHKLCKQTNWPLTKLGFPPNCHTIPLVSSEFTSTVRMCNTGLSNILELIATFLYSIYHQRAAKTNLFHVRGGRFHAGNKMSPWRIVSYVLDTIIIWGANCFFFWEVHWEVRSDFITPHSCTFLFLQHDSSGKSVGGACYAPSLLWNVGGHAPL